MQLYNHTVILTTLEKGKTVYICQKIDALVKLHWFIDIKINVQQIYESNTKHARTHTHTYTNKNKTSNEKIGGRDCFTAIHTLPWNRGLI